MLARKGCERVSQAASRGASIERILYKCLQCCRNHGARLINQSGVAYSWPTWPACAE